MTPTQRKALPKTAKRLDARVDPDMVDALLKVLNDNPVTDERGERRYTFATQNSDSRDFSNIAVWTLKKMLIEAYEAGKADQIARYRGSK